MPSDAAVVEAVGLEIAVEDAALHSAGCDGEEHLAPAGTEPFGTCESPCVASLLVHDLEKACRKAARYWLSRGGVASQVSRRA